MKSKLTSRKFWLATLTNIVSITVVFKEIGGTTGIIFGIIGTIASSLVYMVSESKVDIERAKSTVTEVKDQISKLEGSSDK